MNKAGWHHLFLAVLLFGISCKSTKIVKRERNILRNSEKVIELINANNIDYRTASLKANVTISDEKQKLSFKANIRMQKDSLIWSSLSLMSIAGAKTFLTEDSIKIINYREKSVINEPYSVLNDFLNSDLLTLSNLQKIMFGDWINVAEFEKYRLKFNDTNYVVSTLSERRIDKDWMEKKIDKLEKKIERQEERNEEKAQETLEKKQERKPRKYEGLAIEIEADPDMLKVKQMKVIDYYLEGELKTNYEQFKEVQGFNVPHKVTIAVKGKRNLNVEIEYYRISLNEEISVPFSIPKKYERTHL